MAPKTEKGLTLLQKVICNGSMCIMAERASLFYRRMIIEKGPLLIGMAIKTELSTFGLELKLERRAMRAVA